MRETFTIISSKDKSKTLVDWPTFKILADTGKVTVLGSLWRADGIWEKTMDDKNYICLNCGRCLTHEHAAKQMAESGWDEPVCCGGAMVLLHCECKLTPVTKN